MLENLQKSVRVYPCKVREVWADLDAKDKLILEEALKDKDSWGAKTLSMALRKLGIVLSDSTITRHRNGHCTCSKISK